MNFQTVAKAVELRNLIDNAHLHLPKIGHCVSLEAEFKREHILTDVEVYIDDDDNDIPNHYKYYKEEEKNTGAGTMVQSLEEIQDKLSRIYDFQGFRMQPSGFEDGTITVSGEEIQPLRDISLKDVEKWYALGTDSGFGNVTKQETQHNAQVRSSRELDATQFTVPEQILNDVAAKWGEKYVPESLNMITTRKILAIYGQNFVPQSVTVQPYIKS